MTEASIVNQYRLYCIEEASFVKVWDEEEPTLCPNDHADRTIDPTKTVIVDTVSTARVETLEPTFGKFEHTSQVFNIPSGTTGAVTSHTLQYPMDVQIWGTSLYIGPDNVNDCISATVAPNTTIGVLTAEGATGATGFNVSSTVVTTEHMVKGVSLRFQNGGTTEEPGRVTSFDVSGNKVFMQTPLTQYFPPGTLVQLNLRLLNEVQFFKSDYMHHIAQKGFKSRSLPAYTPITIDYMNHDGKAKKFVIYIEYYYT